MCELQHSIVLLFLSSEETNHFPFTTIRMTILNISALIICVFWLSWAVAMALQWCLKYLIMS